MAAFQPSASSRSLAPSLSPSSSTIAEDSLFVAVTREFNDCKSLLLWALENRDNSGVCLIHVHQPDKQIPTPMGYIHVNLANKHQIEAHRVTQRDKLSKKLEKHLQFCRQNGVVAAKIYVEMDSIEDGIVKVITDQKIRKLVMGAAIDRKYTKGMIEILSEKAKHVRQHSPDYCHIWFVCKKLLIHTREATRLDSQISNVDEYEMPVMDRSFSSSTFGSPLSGPSAPHLGFSPAAHDGQQGVDKWLLNQQMQHPYHSNPSRFMTQESGLEEPEKVKNEGYNVSEELQIARDHISSFERKIEKSNLLVDHLTEMVEKYKKERDNAIREVEEERKQLKKGPSSFVSPLISSELSFQDIEKATSKFDQSLKVGEDAYGVTYKGSFDIQLAVKFPHPRALSDPKEFQQEVDFMNKLSHPNIVNLVGTCPEFQALIYEYCANGNLEDQFSLKAGNQPLKWETRMRIATELCSVLMFLHSQTPQPIIHGDIRAGNIHFDSQLACKLSNFRTSIEISNGIFSLENRTDLRAIGYSNTDPEYFTTEEFTTRSDVYSFGIVLLRLLTGKLAMKLVREVQKAVELDELSGLLDVSAEWPHEQAKLLADLALRCCEMTRDRRPDLDPDVWKAMESIKGHV